MKAWAIVVGINQYPPLAAQPPLYGAVADACDFAEWALDPAGGNVAQDRLFFWTRPWPEAVGPLLQSFFANGGTEWDNEDTDLAPPNQARGPKATEIVDTAQRVGRDARDIAFEADDTETRRIYVFLAGHGLRAKEIGNQTEQTCFVAADFRMTTANNVRGLVPCESFRKALLTDRFNEAILFLDCCRLQTSRLQIAAVPITDFTKEPLGVSWGSGHAAQDGMVAYETIGPPIRGAFSKTLLEGLRSWRPDGATLHMEGLKQYVLANISAHVTQQQSPSILYDPNSPPGPLMVAGPATAATPRPMPQGPKVNVASATTLAPGTQLILRDGIGEIVPTEAPMLAAASPIQLPPLPPGLYSVELAGLPGREDVFRHPGTDSVNI